MTGARAFVSGGGRGIGAEIARSLARDGWHVAVGARNAGQVHAVADEIDGQAVVLDVADPESVRAGIAEAGEVDLLVANAAHTEGHHPPPSWEMAPEAWWRVYQVNVLGVYLCCSAVIPRMLDRGGGRIVITGSGAAHLPAPGGTAYAPSKAAVCRYGEMLNAELGDRVPVFWFDPGLVRTQLTADLADDLPFVSPRHAAELVRKLATGSYDALAGRFLHAVDDDLDELMSRLDEIHRRDLHSIRLRC